MIVTLWPTAKSSAEICFLPAIFRLLVGLEFGLVVDGENRSPLTIVFDDDKSMSPFLITHRTFSGQRPGYLEWPVGIGGAGAYFRQWHVAAPLSPRRCDHH